MAHSSLREKFFGRAAEDEEQAIEARDVKRVKIALFLRNEFFCEDFEPHLKALREQHDPAPAQAKEDMLYSIGVRDGLKLVLAYIDRIRSEVR